jgi:DNA-binding MarR family transcriptional regulator
MHKSTNVISPLVNRLIEKGYLIKEKDKTDSRVVNVRITDKSKKIVDDIVQDISDYSLPCFDGITEEQVDLVTVYLKTILEVMNK